MSFENFLNKYQKEKVIEHKNKVVKNPLVSICVQTYNHEKYIAQCLDGILNQQVNFSFEILLGEDASSDHTLQICKTYAEKYPDKIRLFKHHRANNIKVHGKPTGRFNFLYNLFSANGKYIAVCEGDDYWIDTLKLQKQVDFLERNQNYTIAWTNYKMFDGTHYKTNDFNFKTHQRTIDFNNIFSPYCTLTLTVLFKKSALNLSQAMNFKYFKDNTIYGLTLQYGKGVFINDVTAVYRAHEGGIYSLKSSFFKNYSSYLNIKEIIDKIPNANTKNLQNVKRSLGNAAAFELLKLKYKGEEVSREHLGFMTTYFKNANDFKTKFKYYKRLFKYKFLK